MWRQRLSQIPGPHELRPWELALPGSTLQGLDGFGPEWATAPNSRLGSIERYHPDFKSRELFVSMTHRCSRIRSSSQAVSRLEAGCRKSNDSVQRCCVE